MRVTGLVIYLTADAAADVRAALDARPGFETGELIDGHRLAAVLESPDPRTERATLDWLEALPGVRMVSVAYAWFGEPDEQAAESPQHEEARS